MTAVLGDHRNREMKSPVRDESTAIDGSFVPNGTLSL